MDAVAPAIIGLGIYLIYEAYKNPSPTPLAKIKSAITGASTTTTAPVGSVSNPNPGAVSTLPDSALLP